MMDIDLECLIQRNYHTLVDSPKKLELVSDYVQANLSMKEESFVNIKRLTKVASLMIKGGYTPSEQNLSRIVKYIQEGINKSGPNCIEPGFTIEHIMQMTTHLHSYASNTLILMYSKSKNRNYLIQAYSHEEEGIKLGEIWDQRHLAYAHRSASRISRKLYELIDVQKWVDAWHHHAITAVGLLNNITGRSNWFLEQVNRDAAEVYSDAAIALIRKNKDNMTEAVLGDWFHYKIRGAELLETQDLDRAVVLYRVTQTRIITHMSKLEKSALKYLWRTRKEKVDLKLEELTKNTRFEDRKNQNMKFCDEAIQLFERYGESGWLNSAYDLMQTELEEPDKLSTRVLANYYSIAGELASKIGKETRDVRFIEDWYNYKLRASEEYTGFDSKRTIYALQDAGFAAQIFSEYLVEISDDLQEKWLKRSKTHFEEVLELTKIQKTDTRRIDRSTTKKLNQLDKKLKCFTCENTKT